EQFIFNGVIPKDKFFVMGTHPRSFDSRYWGFVDRKDIKGVSIWAF
ncbi:S26 family signal peptidase, partial [Campylobacter coli]|nr:S26 family signal peptidase [Campylobacter coli]